MSIASAEDLRLVYWFLELVLKFLTYLHLRKEAPKPKKPARRRKRNGRREERPDARHSMKRPTN